MFQAQSKRSAKSTVTNIINSLENSKQKKKHLVSKKTTFEALNVALWCSTVDELKEKGKAKGLEMEKTKGSPENEIFGEAEGKAVIS